MRKIIFQMMVSLDGFIEGPKQDLSWHLVDDEFNKYAIDLLHSIDTIIFGRVAYELFEKFWPAEIVDPATTPDNLEIANQINDMRKIVFSKTMEKHHIASASKPRGNKQNETGRWQRHGYFWWRRNRSKFYETRIDRRI